jgi:DNA-binding NarL/FixJ family response regulator
MTRVPDQSLIVMCIEQYRERPDFATAVSRYNLTPRQIEIARLLVMGLRIADIAGELVLAESTVAQHVKRLLLKTKTRNRAALIAGLLGYNSQSKNGMAAVPYDVYTMKRDKTAYAIT